MKHPFSTFRSSGVAFAIAAGAAAALSSATCRASETTFEGIHVEVVGKGRPVLMIPGLNSSAEVWRDTCQALQPRVQCHLVNLPGFAGQAPVDADPWVESMRDRLIAYTKQAKLEHPAVIGHSLGGELALMLAIAAPERFERVVVVDALPFFGGIRNPAATPDSLKPMAEGLRAGMLAADDQSYHANIRRTLAGMSNQAERLDTLAQWGESSDRRTTAQAMYELTVTDLRGELEKIKAPTLVLGAWASYQAYGATADSVRTTFQTQYANLAGVKIALSEGGYHFLMWDDPTWLRANVREFLNLDGRR
jgi:pimeloyl-ACP methyl ester carboxylesterase